MIISVKNESVKNIVESYRASHDRTLYEVTACSDDPRRTDTQPVNTRTAVLTVQQVTSLHGTVSADEAGRTEAPTGTVTSGTVTTRVVGITVRLGTSDTDVLRRTGASVAIHQVVACTVVLTRIDGTVVYVRLANRT